MRTKLVSAFVLASALATTPAWAGPGDNTLGVALMSARVAADGTLSDGAGAVSVTNNAAGQYIVTFTRNVAGCIAVASPQLNSRIVAANANNSTTVSVFTQVSSTLTFTNAAFNLIVFCAE